MIVAIAGASGLTGNLCLQYLLAENDVDKVISIGRKQLPIEHQKLEQVWLQNGKLETPVQADAFICCLGTTMKKAGSKEAFENIDRHLPVHLANALHQQGCRTSAVVSAMSADTKSKFFYSRVKGLMEEDLQQIGFDALHLLRPAIISGNRQENRPVEKLALKLIKLLEPLLPNALRNYKIIEANTIAKALVHCVLNDQNGHFVYLSDSIKKLSKK